MKALLLIPIITLTLYLIYVYWRHGMTKSISETYRKLIGWERPLFTITMWAVAIPIMIVGIESVPNNWPEVLFFLAGFDICLVGASPAFWTNKMELTAHLIGSYGGIGMGMIACLLYLFSPAVLLSVMGYLAFVIIQIFVKKLRINNYIYWMEVAALVVISGILYLNQQFVI